MMQHAGIWRGGQSLPHEAAKLKAHAIGKRGGGVPLGGPNAQGIVRVHAVVIPEQPAHSTSC